MVSAQFRQGDNLSLSYLCFMGACPGRNEGIERRPFSPNGNAGRSLRVLVRVLSEVYPDRFLSERLDDYSLLNAHPTPRPRGTPKHSAIASPENRSHLAHLVSPLGNALEVICLGRDAEFAATHALKNARVLLSLPHPTSRTVNSKRRGSWELNWRAWLEES
ncbi:uracil-DNA glycosylase family protein [Pararhodobacter aggregans]|uniref:uracil-DNA glycosylase family protein n=1 Tax=Pararhodobacter aggregans TaxID=404875 RepID=UPI003A8CE7D9